MGVFVGQRYAVGMVNTLVGPVTLGPRGGRDQVLEHLGSAHAEMELTALLQIGRERLHPDQDMLDGEF